MPSDLDLLRTELVVLWQVDSRHRINGQPELVIAAATDGMAAAVSSDVPDTVAESLLDLVGRAVPSDLAHPPRVLYECRELLNDPELTISGGPSYVLPATLPRDENIDVLSSDSPAASQVAGLRPANWEPAEWAELVSGGLGAPWAMVLDGDRVVSICHTPRLSVSGAEAGTWTDPAFRGRGYAAATTIAWADLLAPIRLQLFYSTSADNRSSQRVAERLGLRCIGWLWKLIRPS